MYVMCIQSAAVMAQEKSITPDADVSISMSERREESSRSDMEPRVSEEQNRKAESEGTYALTPEGLKRMSLEELMEISVTSASRREERLSNTAAAIDVITADEIRRSGATTIPDALRLATGLHVARYDSRTWAISARGFNITSANKMQVLMDGRSLYTPLYSGVFWDVQDYPLEDIDRIEVIRGPGAALWGANAVNGVINIITKSARETQGLLFSGGYGTEEQGFGTLRYGDQLGEDTYFRVYSKYFNRDEMGSNSTVRASDDWRIGQSGFRLDSEYDPENTLTFQGDLYYGRIGDHERDDTEVAGFNMMGQWTHLFDVDNELRIQMYYDHTKRDMPFFYRELRDTYDLDLTHHFNIGERHKIVWGLNYRISTDDIRNSTTVAFLPDERTLTLYSGFIQDEITLIENQLNLILGTKLEYGTLSDFEYQPSARMSWTPNERNTLWASVSRAVRTPTRIDVDFYAYTTQRVPYLIGNDDFGSEELLAFELGYRVQMHENLHADLATFYNLYEDQRSQKVTLPDFYPIQFENKLEADVYGVELALEYQMFDWWRLGGSYTYLHKEFDLDPDSLDPYGGSTEGNDPDHRFNIHSAMNLTRNLEFDLILRYVDDLPSPFVPDYLVMDLRLGWFPTENLEMAVVGRNLLDDQHPEFVPQTGPQREVENSVYGKVTLRF